MGQDTSIEWTHGTLNLAWGCRKVDKSPQNGACYKCFMFRMSDGWGIDPTLVRRFDLHKRIKDLEAWPDEKVLVFLNDMSDTFGEFFAFEEIEKWHRDLIERFPNKQFQLLTKRIGRAMLFYYQRGRVPDNVWMGTSIGARDRLKRLDQLRMIPARIRFVSFEPLLEDLGKVNLEGIHWVIIGGESDKSDPRPMKLEWAESLIEQAREQGVAVFFKQRGGKGGERIRRLQARGRARSQGVSGVGGAMNLGLFFEVGLAASLALAGIQDWRTRQINPLTFLPGIAAFIGFFLTTPYTEFYAFRIFGFAIVSLAMMMKGWGGGGDALAFVLLGSDPALLNPIPALIFAGIAFTFHHTYLKMKPPIYVKGAIAGGAQNANSPVIWHFGTYPLVSYFAVGYVAFLILTVVRPA